MTLPKSRVVLAIIVVVMVIVLQPFHLWSQVLTEPSVTDSNDLQKVSAVASTEDSVSQLRTRLKDVEAGLADPGGDSEATARQLIKEARAALDAAEASRTAARNYGQSISNFAEEKARLESEIRTRRNTPVSLTAPLSVSDGVDAISTRLTARQSNLNTLKAELKQLEDAGAADASRPAAIQRELQENRAAIEQNQKTLKELEATGDTSPSGLRTVLLRARAIQHAAASQKLNEELNTHAQRYELNTLRRQLHELEVQTVEAQIRRINELMAEARQVQARNLAGNLEDLPTGLQNRIPAAQEIIARNNEYSESNLEVVDKLKILQKSTQSMQGDLEKLNEELESLSKELDIGDADEILRQVMVERRQDLKNQLVSGVQVKELEDRLTKARLQRFRYEQALRQLNPGTPDFEEKIQSMVPDDGDRESNTEAIRRLLIKQKEVLEALEANQRELQISLEKALTLARDYESLLKNFGAFLNRQLMWVPTSKPIWLIFGSIDELPEALGKLKELCVELVDRFLTVTQIVEVVLWSLVALSVSLFATLKSRGWRKKFEDIATRVRRVSTDQFVLTLRMLFYCLLFPLRWTAWIWAAFMVFWTGARDLVMGEAIAYGLLVAAIIWHWHSFLRWMNAEKGVCPIHFRWRGELLARSLSCFRWLVPIICVMSFVITVLEFTGDPVLRDVISDPALMVCFLSYMVFFILIPGPDGKNLQQFFDVTGVGWLQRFTPFWRWFLIAVPAVLLGLTAWGYHFAVVNLGLHSLFMLLWLGAGLIFYFLGIRWFAVKERRLALEQALERRRVQQSQQKTEDPDHPSLPPVPEENSDFDLSAVKDQTRGFLKTLFGIFILVGLWSIWKQVFPAIEFLDQVQLWSYKTLGEGDAEITKFFTLFDAFLFVVIIFLTSAAARNMPGVIEITLLEKLPIQAGVRYAITTVFQYSVVATGIFILFKMLGFEFRQFGWMLAALSLGLGFGLQEVVANFVCGILLLLERPIRVGDIVTVSGISGVVSKIRIRATTITDWDRKDFVVPNKAFITGHILNWTLSNKLNRVVVNVGIAYGSDIEQAIRVLRDIVQSHPDILKDPEPMVTFESFGDSALNLTIRFFLPTLERRLMIIHEIHTRIHDRFKAENIQIPFPQRDVHLFHKNSPAPPLT